MRILNTLLFSVLFIHAISAQIEFECDSIGIEAPFGLNTVFTPTNPSVNSEMCVQFNVENFVDVLGTTGTLSFDPSQLLWLSSTSLLTNIGGVNFNNNGVTSGQLSFLWTDLNVQGVDLPNGTPFMELCFVVTAEPGQTINFRFNESLVPAFPASEVIYQTSPMVACEDKFIVLNGADVASVQVACDELTITNLSACKLDENTGSLSFEMCGNHHLSLLDLTMVVKTLIQFFKQIL